MVMKRIEVIKIVLTDYETTRDDQAFDGRGFIPEERRHESVERRLAAKTLPLTSSGRSVRDSGNQEDRK